ncbi:MAG: ergothioneine biosynthesis protein EgtB [Gammaproteobacteria bacterium]|nr:ergothioneine biosynthesis protein EgtB [Gammaproteobacteria bacterium]
MSQTADRPVSGGGAAARPATESLSSAFARIRATTALLTSSLQPEDTVIQTMPDVSPTKWHLAHTSWFFENFVLTPDVPGYRPFNEQFGYLFNSYYFSVGTMHQRPHRGMLSRPTLADILDYRAHVNEAMSPLLDGADDDLRFLTVLGLNHEQQHQELILTDIKHVFSLNPLRPGLRELQVAASVSAGAQRFIEFAGGITEAGHAGDGFCFDNETPRHEALLQPYALGDRLVTNHEYADFVADGGYTTCAHWLSDGWTTVQTENWRRPLYWSDDLQQEFSLSGMRRLDPNAPVCHLSLYEADAYARWAGARLPTEFEWENAATTVPVAGNFMDAGLLHPAPAGKRRGLKQMYGDVWEWTSSAYAPYPGFKALAGSLGEYNGKFMCGQAVLRGGSCATPADHIRATYRNFFYPHQRWQFAGLRLARDV